MALWGNNDAVGTGGTVSLNYATGAVTGSGTTFGETGAAQEGDVIRFGSRTGTYFGDAVIVSIAGTQSLTIGSTAGLSGASIAGTSFLVSQLPKSSILDSHYSESATLANGFDSLVYGTNEVSTEAETGTQYELTHGGWVGVTTYNDNESNLRVKKETLVAMSGITTGGIAYHTP